MHCGPPGHGEGSVMHKSLAHIWDLGLKAHGTVIRYLVTVVHILHARHFNHMTITPPTPRLRGTWWSPLARIDPPSGAGSWPLIEK